MRGKTSAVQNAKQKAKTTKPRRKEELIHMKFTVEKRLLNEAVTNLQRAVSSKTSIPALEGILIRSEENRLILTAYDLEIGMQTELPAIISAPGAIILTAKLFAEIVRRSPDEDITIDVDDRNTATITSGVSCFTIIGMDSAGIPGAAENHRRRYNQNAAGTLKKYDSPDAFRRRGQHRKADPSGQFVQN